MEDNKVFNSIIVHVGCDGAFNLVPMAAYIIVKNNEIKYQEIICLKDMSMDKLLGSMTSKVRECEHMYISTNKDNVFYQIKVLDVDLRIRVFSEACHLYDNFRDMLDSNVDCGILTDVNFETLVKLHQYIHWNNKIRIFDTVYYSRINSFNKRIFDIYPKLIEYKGAYELNPYNAIHSCLAHLYTLINDDLVIDYYIENKLYLN